LFHNNNVYIIPTYTCLITHTHAHTNARVREHTHAYTHKSTHTLDDPLERVLTELRRRFLTVNQLRCGSYAMHKWMLSKCSATKHASDKHNTYTFIHTSIIYQVMYIHETVLI